MKDVEAALSLDRQVVRRWRKRFCESGVHGLKDRPRRGRTVTIGKKVWEKIVVLIVQPPTEFGVACNRWTLRDLSRFLNQRYGWQVSPSAIGQFLRQMELKPHRVKYWLNPKDPDLAEKAAKICRLYIRPPRGATVLSIDEKPGVQLLGRKAPDQMMQRGRLRRIEYEYKRCGTRNIFAAFNTQTGEVTVRVTHNRKQPAVLAFLNHLCARYRRGKIIMITDNIRTRTNEAAKQWLRQHPRVSFVFTPVHASWLNQVEIWFSILSKKCLKHRAFDNGCAFAGAIYSFVRHWNNNFGHPFEWSYTGKPLHA
jgi:transposase